MFGSYITRPHEKKAAPAFMKKALKRHGSPEMITTDGLRSFKAATTELGNAAEQVVVRWSDGQARNRPFWRSCSKRCGRKLLLRQRR